MSNLRKITYYRKIIFKDKTIVSKKGIKRNVKNLIEFKKDGIKFIMFPKKRNAIFKGLNNYFLVGKYPNEKSKNYLIGKIDNGLITKTLNSKFVINKFRKMDLYEFIRIYLKKFKSGRGLKIFKQFIKREYKVELKDA